MTPTADLIDAAPVRSPRPSIGLSSGRRVALVNMPWGSVCRPSLAMAILKPCVRAAGFDPDVHLLNVDFAERLGIGLYESIHNAGLVPSEWFFSHLLFGERGTGELAVGWDTLKAEPAAAEIVDILIRAAGSEARCRQLADDDAPWFIEQCVARVDWSQYLVVGFTTTFPQSAASLALAKRIKDRWPHVAIVFGGANVDSEMGVEFLRGFEWVDYVVHGEAEHSFPALLDCLACGDTRTRVPGVSMRRDGAVIDGHHDATPVADLGNAPLPDYTDYVAALDRTDLRRKVRMRLYFESSRGCWWGAKHHCTFCGLNGNGMAFRKKDPQKVFDEIVHLSETYGCVDLAATDNILSMDYFSQLLPRLIDADLDLNVFYEVKANLKPEHVKLLRDAGITIIQPGIESLNTRILELMRKGTTAIQNIQLLKWCHEYAVSVGWNILYGFPGETPEDYADLPRLCCALSHLGAPGSVARVHFDRFSPYFFDRERFGLTLTHWAGYRFIFPARRVDLDRIAYMFDGDWHAPADPEVYIQPVIEAATAWRQHWEAGDSYCYYDKGPDYVMIYDHRPRQLTAPPSLRQICLRDHVAALYLFCGERRSHKAIVQMIEQRGAVDAAEQVPSWLDQLVSQDLMFREGDQYLSLAVRRKPE